MPIGGPTVDHGEIRAWAERHGVVPTEILPCHVDHEPTLLQLMVAREVRDRPDVRMISWNEFFLRFDMLGLAFVYDDSREGYNELLQRDELAPHIGHGYRRERPSN
jgi:hypothetical protein